MATQPTQNPVPSESPRDLKFNAGKIDEFVTSMGWTYTDRFGVQHYTIEGMRWLAQQAISAFGYITLDSFEDGNTLTLPNQVLRLEFTGEYYRWDGAFPKSVPANSTPESTGGIGTGKWLSVGDAVLRSDLAGPGGAQLVYDGEKSVSDSLQEIENTFDKIQSLDSRTTPPPTELYSGFKHWNPIWDDGHQLGQYVFRSPTHVDFQFASDPINSATGPVFSMGRTGLDQRSANFSQDSYEIRNVMMEGGTGKLVAFEPWTSMMATVEKCRVINPEEAGQWVINFKAQNWWPHILNNTYMEYNDKAGCFVKAIDDGGNPLDRYTANSRALIAQNRCAWQGLAAGAGIMSYTSAVATRIKDNSAQNAKTCCILGYPSLFTTVDGLYAEMNFGNQQAVQIGDSDATSPHNIMSDILIRDVYANLHGINSNRFIVPGSNAVVINEVELDRIFIGGIPTSGFIQPLVTINDLPFQKIIAGRINAANMPLINLTDNYIAVTDKYGCDVPALNGDLVIIDTSSVSIPANISTKVAPGWYARCTAATTFTRSGSGTPNNGLRNSRYIAAINSPAGATSVISFQHPRADLLKGRAVTLQCLVNADTAQDFIMAVSVVNSDGSKTLLNTKTFSGGGSWKELTMTVGIDGVATANSFVLCEIACTTGSQKNIYVTGHRLNIGAFGLCGDANKISFAETLRMKDDYQYVNV